jgi:predicted HAD superfamily hydrolase
MTTADPRSPAVEWRDDVRLLPAHRLLEQGAFDVLSLDIFDTLVWRIVPEPVDAFVLLGERLDERGVLHPQVSPHLFARLREQAERRARLRVVPATDAPEVGLAEIYRELPDHLFHRTTAERIAEVEVEFEKGITFPDLEVVSFATLAREKLGARVVLVSDTYFSESELRHILDREPFRALGIERIFTSNQYKVGKGFGLFGVVVDALGVDPGRMLHIGDNHDADIEAAHASGIRTVFFDKLPGPLRPVLEREGLYRTGWRHRHKPALHPTKGDFGLSAIRAKAVSAGDRPGGEESTNPYWRFGNTVLGPVFTAYAEWIHDRARTEGVDTVYGVMREGEFLCRLVNGARDYLGSPVKAKQLWLSRQVCSRAGILEASPAELLSFLNRRAAPTVGEVLGVLGVDLRRVPALHNDAGARLDDTEVVARLVESVTALPDVRATIVANASALRTRLVDYLLRTVESDTGPIMLVDLGWGGTIQASLDSALAKAGLDRETIGLYLMTNEGVLDRILDGVNAEGFLADAGHPEDVSWITRTPEILEQVCMYHEGTLLDFDERAEPVLASPEQRPAQTLQRQAVQDGVLAFQREWGRYSGVVPTEARSLHDGARALLVQALTGFIVSPTAEEASLFGGWQHDQNFGSTSSEGMVVEELAPSLRYMTPRQFLDLPMTTVYWPFGLAAQYNPPLAAAASAIADGLVPVEAFAASSPTTVRVLVDSGGGFSEAIRTTAGPNANGLGYLSGEVRTRPLRGVMIRCADGPGVLRIDWMNLAFSLTGETEPRLVRIESPEEFSALHYRNGVPLSDNMVVSWRQAPEVVFRPPVDWGEVYGVKLEMGFAWLPVGAVRGKPPANAEVVLHAARRVAGKLRNVWLNAAQEAGDRRRPQS